MARLAFLFPGQGAQVVGMGEDFAKSFPAAARVYDEAGRTLGWDVAARCFAGPQDELDRTSVSQPAILTSRASDDSVRQHVRRKGFDHGTRVIRRVASHLRRKNISFQGVEQPAAGSIVADAFGEQSANRMLRDMRVQIE